MVEDRSHRGPCRDNVDSSIRDTTAGAERQRVCTLQTRSDITKSGTGHQCSACRDCGQAPLQIFPSNISISLILGILYNH